MSVATRLLWFSLVSLWVCVAVHAQDMPPIPFPPGPGDTDTPPDAMLVTDEFWSTGIFSELLRLFDNTFTESRWPLFEAALGLLHWLAVLEVALTLIWLALSNDAQSLIGVLCGQLLLIGFMVEIVSQFPTYAQVWSDGCVWVGLTIGGTAAAVMGTTPMTLEQFKDAGFVMLRGLTKLNQPYDYVLSYAERSWYTVLKTSVLWGPMMVTLVIAAVSFMAIGVLVILAWIEVWLVSAIAIPFLPLMVLKYTREVGGSMLASVLSAGIRVGTLASLVGVMDGVIGRMNMTDPANITLGMCIAVMCLGIAFAVLAGLLPAKLAGRVTGQAVVGSSLISLVRTVRRAA